jgi:hypothetical protein
MDFLFLEASGKMKSKIKFGLLALYAVLVLSTPVQAVLILNTLTYADIIYDFHIFNNQKYENDPRFNFTLTITDEGQNQQGKNQVGFLFDNNSTISSSITDIYFDARPDTGSSLNFCNVSIIESLGVSFSKYASPKTLPGGSELTPKFDKTPEYSADSDRPVFHNGINPDECLKITFTLKNDKDFDAVIGELSGSTLRIGIHIQGLPKDTYQHCCHTCYSNSASAINCTQPQPIPEPATLLFFGTAGVWVLTREKHSV